jgi:hypothetical protein
MSRRLAAALLVLLSLAAIAPLATRASDALADAKKALDAAIAARDGARVKEALKQVAAEPGEKAVKVVAAGTPAPRDHHI